MTDHDPSEDSAQDQIEVNLLPMEENLKRIDILQRKVFLVNSDSIIQKLLKETT